MICASVSLATPLLSNENLFDRLMEHHKALLDLQAEGIVQTNFMKCDENSIYVFASYLENIPSALCADNVEMLKRPRNAYFVERCAYHLRCAGEEEAAALVEGMINDSRITGMTTEAVHAEGRKAYLRQLLTLCHGFLTELVERKLVSFGPGPGYHLNASLKDRYEETKKNIRIKSSHLSPKELFDRICAELKEAGFDAAADKASAMYSHLIYL